MKNIRITTLAKIIIPGYLLCAVVIFISFISYNSAIHERNTILHRTLEGLGGALVWQATPALHNAEARSESMYVLLMLVIAISVAITLIAIFVITYKLMPIRNLVDTATELATYEEEEAERLIPKDELGFLTRELAHKIKTLDAHMKLLEDTADQANAASRAKSDFLSTMSHEMRTPMNAIIGMTHIAKNEKDPSRIAYALDRIEDASSHLLGVINDILDISKIEMNKMELSCINFNFEKMIERVSAVLTTKMADKRQEFTLDIDPAIPRIVCGDDHRIAQVVVNLLSNANKFTPLDGSIMLQARLLESQEKSCTVQIMVKDSGIGITPEQQQNLFRKYQQAEAGTSRKYGGTGLGLAITKSILEMMGGDIWIESEPGRGSSFFIKLPFVIPENPQEDLSSEESIDIADHGGSDFSGKVVLLVDDVEINLEIACAILEPTGLIIDTATRGDQAIEAVTANPGRYDLILMDIQMPGIDGMETTRIIRTLDTPGAAEIPIIAMTANVFKEDIEKCLEAGMNGHLGKPIDITDVMKTLSHYLGA